MSENNRGSFLEIEDELNEALKGIGRDIKLENDSIDEKVSAITVQDLLEELKTDEFEKIYIATSSQSNSVNKQTNIDVDKMQNLAEYQLSQMKQDDTIDVDARDKLKSAANFYLIPHIVEQKYSVGNVDKSKMINVYTVNDTEGYSLYTIIDNKNINISSSFRSRIEKYLRDNYSDEISSGNLDIDEVIEYFTPHSIEELYSKVENDHPVTMRFLPMRIDEFVETKGLEPKEFGINEVDLEEYDDLSEENKVSLRDQPEDDLEKETDETLDKTEEANGIVKDGKSIKVDEKEKQIQEPLKESYIERIAKLNNVSPAVVNTRVVENFEKVEEDTGIHLKGKYARGGVVAVRIPYKLGYRTFLVEKDTGLTIDGKGTLDRRPGKLYDYDEIEEYFRFKLTNGKDGGENGKPLRYDESRDYTTYVDEYGDVKKEKFINNGKKIDMNREERQRYLTEVGEIDKRLSEAIEEYQKKSTHENYQKVKDLIQEKVNIDNKYNALDNQRELTKETMENTEKAIGRDLDEDDDWFPSPGERFYH